MKSIKLSEKRVQKLGAELYYSGEQDFDENLRSLKFEIARLEYLRSIDAQVDEKYPKGKR